MLDKSHLASVLGDAIAKRRGLSAMAMLELATEGTAIVT
jgi:hypothetical protein